MRSVGSRRVPTPRAREKMRCAQGLRSALQRPGDGEGWRSKNRGRGQHSPRMQGRRSRAPHALIPAGETCVVDTPAAVATLPLRASSEAASRGAAAAFLLKASNDLAVVPVGGGITVGSDHLQLEGRFTYRQTFNEDLVRAPDSGKGSLKSWAAAASCSPARFCKGCTRRLGSTDDTRRARPCRLLRRGDLGPAPSALPHLNRQKG